MAKMKVGLALGSGAARGLAHIGVLEVLQQEGIPIDIITGTSAGALIGALYASSLDTSKIKQLALDVAHKRLIPLVDPSLPKTGLIKGQKIKELISQSIGGDIAFSDLKIPFACIATDIDTGEEVVIDHGSVAEAVRASISIPAVFTLTKWEGRYLVDGNLVNPVPVNILKRMGADLTIAVSVSPDVTDRKKQVKKERYMDSRKPNMIGIIMQSIHIATYALVKASLEEADIVIGPQVAHTGSADFHHAEEFIRLGKLAAQDSIPEIRRKLKSLNP